jgi:cysteine desulfurase / selenocysteine lyase
MSSSIYLDYAATAAIRPPSVAAAVSQFLLGAGATPGRSGHAPALAAGRAALRCRRLLARLFHVPGDPGRITFQLNATHALNTALFGVLAPGDRVVRTQFDHNSIRRPVAELAARGVEESILPVERGGDVDLDTLRRLLEGSGKPARMLVFPHASNVTGLILPAREMADLAHAVGAIVLIDAAQTAGNLPIDVDALGADLLAFTGHKGLLGPQGVGGLWVREGVEVRPLLFGGTGGDSGPRAMPDVYPDHLEAGTQNAPGIVGLAAGLDWVLERGVDRLREAEVTLAARLAEGLRLIPGVEVLSAPAERSVGIVTVRVEGVPPDRLALRLEREHGVQGRAGLHCAPEIHQVLGTGETGAFRLSVGWATTTGEIDRTLAAFRSLSKEGER